MAKPVTDLEKIIHRNTKYDGQEEAEALMEWVERDDAINITDFCWRRKMPHAYLYDLAKKDPKLSDCLQLAYCKLSERRERMACSGDLPGYVYSKSQGQFDRGLRMYEKMMAKYNQDLKVAAQAPPPPRDEIIAAQNENLLLQHRIKQLEEQLKAQKELDSE